MTKISLVKCDDYNNADNAIRKALSLLGGISAFVKPSERILIKPNLLSPIEPSKAVTTNPEIVRAVTKLVKEAGAVPVVGDSPGGAIRNIKNVWEVTGMERVCKEENVEMINFEAVGSKEFDIGDENIKRVNFSNAVLDCDGIINLPKLKTHMLMGFSALVGAIQRKGNDYPYVDTKKCISCFCCHERCPKKAVGFKKSFLAKIFIKDN